MHHIHLTFHQLITTSSSISTTFCRKMLPQPAEGRKCFPRAALQQWSLPEEVPPRLHTAGSPEDPHPREAFLLWALWKAFNHSGNLSGHTLGSSPTCAPSVTCLLLPGVSQIPPGNPFRTTDPGICPQVQVLSAPRRKFTMICHFYNTKDGWHMKSFGGYWVQGVKFTWM